jgi:hypothetical protein
MWNRRFLFRWVSATLVLAFALALPMLHVHAKHMAPDLINVPVERLIRNLEALAKNDPNNAEVRYNLARVHSMAYAQKTESAQVWKGRENEGVWFGYEPPYIPFNQPPYIPFTVNPTTEKDKLKAARSHLNSAIELYREVLRLTPNHPGAGLGYAWCIEQSGDKQKAVAEYRKLINASWKNEKHLKRADMSWHSVTAEAAAYLIPLLDQNKDKEEINTLNERIKKMEMVPRPITPIVIPLQSGLTVNSLEDHSASVAFDADGSGLHKPWTWITRMTSFFTRRSRLLIEPPYWQQ